MWKVCVRNSDLARGKGSGYRLIYHVRPPAVIVLVTLYSKVDQGDITAQQIRRILKEFEAPAPL